MIGPRLACSSDLTVSRGNAAIQVATPAEKRTRARKVDVHQNRDAAVCEASCGSSQAQSVFKHPSSQLEMGLIQTRYIYIYAQHLDRRAT